MYRAGMAALWRGRLARPAGPGEAYNDEVVAVTSEHGRFVATRHIGDSAGRPATRAGDAMGCLTLQMALAPDCMLGQYTRT